MLEGRHLLSLDATPGYILRGFQDPVYKVRLQAEGDEDFREPGTDYGIGIRPGGQFQLSQCLPVGARNGREGRVGMLHLITDS